MGASAGVGRALAERLAREGFDLVVAARDLRDLDAVSSDLQSRFGVKSHSAAVDLSENGFDPEAFLEKCQRDLGGVDALFVVSGFSDEEDCRPGSDDLAVKIANTNYLNAVRLLQVFARVFEGQGHGRLVGFGSIAAAAPRKKNMVYASAKAGLETYLHSLRHYFVGTDVLVQGYLLGYVDTAQTFGKDLALPAISAEAVAEKVVSSLDRDIGIIYYPCYWKLITGALRLLPWFLYKKLDF